MRHNTLPRALAPLFLLLTAPTVAVGAESYDSCTGYIDSLPATITVQGTWCLRKDLNTAMSAGAAITVATNNVIVNCNDFKVGGLPAGLATAAAGVAASDRANATVRRCGIRGFRTGISLTGSSGGHVVEDNRLDGNTQYGIVVSGNGSLVQRNLVGNTGGSAGFKEMAVGVEVTGEVDVLDNTITAVAPTPGDLGKATSYGIRTVGNSGGTIAGNHVKGLLGAGPGGSAYGIYNLASGRVTLRDNVLTGDYSDGSTAMVCTDANARALGNTAAFFLVNIAGCRDDGNQF